MKKFHTLSSILEQDTKSVFGKFKITDTQVAPRPFITLQWTYEYSWPKNSPSLGTIESIANAIANSGKSEIASIISEIQKAADGSIVGISRNPGNTTNDRFFGKDLLGTSGFIYIFKPEKIDLQKAADKKIGTDGKIGKLEAIEVDADFPKYLITAATASSATANSTTSSTKSPVKTADFKMVNQKYSRWFNVKIREPYLGPIETKFSSTKVTIEGTSPITAVFRQLIGKLPDPYNLDIPGDKSLQETFSRDLQTALVEILVDAAKYDPTQFTQTNIDTLDINVFNKIVDAILVIAFNTGRITTGAGGNTENEILPSMYDEAFKAAKKQSESLGSTIATSSGGTTNGTATANFDGSAINTEMDLAKIMSGGFIGYGKTATDVDSIDKVKAVWNSYVPSNYAKKFDEIVAKLPFNAKTDVSLLEFKDIQYFALVKNGTYGPLTKAAFKKAFEKSSIK